VDPAAFMLMSVFAGSGLSLLWVEWHRRRDAKKEAQRLCLHNWRWFCVFGNYWSRQCLKCDKQEPCKHDGDSSERGV
jgi:hypothetical protein